MTGCNSLNNTPLATGALGDEALFAGNGLDDAELETVDSEGVESGLEGFTEGEQAVEKSRIMDLESSMVTRYPCISHADILRYGVPVRVMALLVIGTVKLPPILSLTHEINFSELLSNNTGKHEL